MAACVDSDRQKDTIKGKFALARLLSTHRFVTFQGSGVACESRLDFKNQENKKKEVTKKIRNLFFW